MDKQNNSAWTSHTTVDKLKPQIEARSNAPQTCLWQIGEQLKLNPKAMTKGNDYPSVVADKHKAMGQTVSSYLKKGRCLVDNAANGLFPKY
jgi:hypothetical protein